MRPDRHQSILAPWQFIAILALLVCIGILLNPDLLKFYAGKPDLLISEFLADNQTNRIDADGDHSDWIEIYNASDETISLKGWYLTDDFRNFKQWMFPIAELEPGQFLLVWASGKNRTNWVDDLHTNFKLSSEGEYLALVRPNGKTIAHEYLPKYPKQKADISFGLTKSHFESQRWLSKEPLRDYSYFADPTPLETNAHGSLTSKGLKPAATENSNGDKEQ
jgi:hypothetical protein